MGLTPYQSTIHWGSNEGGAAYRKMIEDILKIKGGKAAGWTEARVVRVGVVMLARKLGIPVPAGAFRNDKD